MNSAVTVKGSTTPADAASALANYMKQRMKDELSLVEKAAPATSPSESRFIYVSSDWRSSERMLVIVPKAGSGPGLWDTGVTLGSSLVQGSLLPYFQKAVYQGYGVLVLNPGTAVDTSSGCPAEATRSGHINWACRSFVNPGCELMVVLAEDSGDLAGEFVAANANIKAFALLESSHQVTSGTPTSVTDVLAARAVNWAAASEHQSPAVALAALQRSKGCVCLSAAPGGPAGATPNAVVEQVFSFFKQSQTSNTPVNATSLIQTLTTQAAAQAASSAAHAADEQQAQEEAKVMEEEAEAKAGAELGGAAQANATAAGLARANTAPSSAGSVRGGAMVFGQEKHCYICNRNFTLFMRRHHCRMCLGAVCNADSPDRLFLAGKSTPQRVCTRCAAKGEEDEAEGEGGEGQSNETGITEVTPDNTLSVDSFDLLKVVGKGAFGKVMLVRKKEGLHHGEIFAMKILKKSHVFAKKQVDHTKSERRILRELTNPFVVRLRFAFQSEDKLYLVMDYYSGGSLFFHLRKVRFFSENRARFYAAELLLALDYLHSMHIVYRDLKLENILLDHSGHLALTDFGLSKENVTLPDGAETFCGTAEYIAPELLKGQAYGAAVDWWSFGILLYEMMTGVTPFFSRNRKQMFHDIVARKLTFPLSFSPDSRSLISGLLQRTPSMRLGGGPRGAEEIKSHPFFQSIDWRLLEQRGIEPPFKPRILSMTDTAYVPKPFINEVPADTPPTQSQLAGVPSAQAHFTDFTFMGDSQLAGRN